MAKNEGQATLVDGRPVSDQSPEKTAAKKPGFDDDDVVTVIWKSWGTTGMPRTKVTYFDRHQFVGGVGRRIPYRDVKKWVQQGHGIIVLPQDADESDFIRATGHAPLEDDEFSKLLRATPPEKLAALLGPQELEKIATYLGKS